MPLDDATIARFEARKTAIRRRGFSAQDAGDLAERQPLDVATLDRQAATAAAEPPELPPGTRQIGFYSYGEISPFASGGCDLHNQTMTLTTFAEA